MGGPREGQVTFSCLRPKTKIYRMNSKVQHGLWSNLANWTEFLSSQMSNISYRCSWKIASAPFACSLTSDL